MENNDNKIETLKKELQEAMREKRSENALMEKAQTRLLMEFVERERKRFEFADTSLYILKDKNEIDIMLIMDQIVEWSKKLKTLSKKIY